MIEGGPRDQHTAGLTDLLETGRDVDAVAEQVFSLDYNIAKVDADAEHDPTLSDYLGLALSNSPLHRDCASHRIDHRTELGDDAVACKLDSVAMMFDQ